MNLEDLGLSAPRLVAGFAGGVVHALAFKQKEPFAVVASVISGTFTANFLSPVAAHYAGDWLGDGACAFIVGLTAMALVQGIAFLVSSKLRGLAGQKKGDPSK